MAAHKKPAAAGEPSAWEACATDLTPQGRPVWILDREWLPGEWQPITDQEKVILDAAYGVLKVRKVKDG
jgi:hypothetical protein